MASLSDYYAVLQVHPNAEKEIIDVAYRRLAAKYHPDVNPSPKASEKMARINAAYAVLSDSKKRAAYDATRIVSGIPWPGPTTRLSLAAWRRYLVPAGIMLLLTLLPRLGLRAGMMLIGLLLVTWLFLSLTKQWRSR